jgi:hypothetical protein
VQDQVVARVAMRTAEECLEAWHYVRPYAEGIESDRKILSRLQGRNLHKRLINTDYSYKLQTCAQRPVL